MIQSGGWSNLRTIDEHLKLARVAISFKPELDEAFKINVAKMRVQLPQNLREEIEKAIGPVVRMADKAYRNGSKPSPNGTSSPSNNSVGNNVQAKPTLDALGSRASQSVHSNSGCRLWAFEELTKEIESVATPEEKPVVKAVISRLRQWLRSAKE
jgi:hypothetical protein